MKKAAKTRGFRPWPENQERLDYAEKMGFDLSQVVNSVLRDHLRDWLLKAKDTKAKTLREVLSAPVP